MKVAFTGGGSAGHVTPNLAIMERFISEGAEIHYFGTQEGIEHQIIKDFGGVPYHVVPSERLRRYASWRNLLTPFLVLKGLASGAMKVRKVKPAVLFSKGGFVSFPVVVGAWLNGVPVIIHESDLTPGLANKLSFPFADKICVGFKDAGRHIKDQKKVVFTGAPLRQAIFEADAERGREVFGLDAQRPVFMVTGGSLGARHINEVVREALPSLLKLGQVVHLCGKGNLDEAFADVSGYQQFEYLNDHFADLMAASDVIICRAGANTLMELAALKKPSLLIPLPTASSRGDQRKNAESFAEQGLARVLLDEDMTPQTLLAALSDMTDKNHEYVQALTQYDLPDSVSLIHDLMMSLSESSKNH